MARKQETTWFQKHKEVAHFILLVIVAVSAFYRFVWEDILVPKRRPPSVTLVATLDELDRADGMIAVRAHLVVATMVRPRCGCPHFRGMSMA